MEKMISAEQIINVQQPTAKKNRVANYKRKNGHIIKALVLRALIGQAQGVTRVREKNLASKVIQFGV